MEPVKVAENVYWVGAVDWNERHFHGNTYVIPRGTTYNSYLIVDDQITLIDTVRDSFSDEMFERIKKIADIDSIHNIIVNHVEPDHSGSIERVLKANPEARVYCTAKGKEGLEKYYFDHWDFQIVKTGSQLKLGKKNLRFIEAPMLHWPDSMFTCLVEDKILFSNDAFGQHLASSQRFADEIDQAVLMDEAAAYYANILSPFARLIQKKIEEIQDLGVPIGTIAPSHGAIWRFNLNKIIQAYLKWAQGETENRVVIAYETIWGSSEKMAKMIAEGIISQGIAVHLTQISRMHLSALIKEIMLARGLLIGSATVNNSFLPGLAPLLEELKGLKIRNKAAATFGSYGWGGGAVKGMEESLIKAGAKLIVPSFAVRFVPSEEELRHCFEFGKLFAETLKS